MKSGERHASVNEYSSFHEYSLCEYSHIRRDCSRWPTLVPSKWIKESTNKETVYKAWSHIKIECLEEVTAQKTYKAAEWWASENRDLRSRQQIFAYLRSHCSSQSPSIFELTTYKASSYQQVSASAFVLLDSDSFIVVLGGLVPQCRIFANIYAHFHWRDISWMFQ
jgi:hypothetical protein